MADSSDHALHDAHPYPYATNVSPASTRRWSDEDFGDLGVAVHASGSYQGGMEDKLVTLTVYYSLIEARVCVSMLEAHGIFALAPTELANNAPHLMTALGGIPVMVIGSDYEAAKALLAHIEAEAEIEPPPMAKPPLRRMWDAVVGAVVLLLFGVPPAPTPPKAGRRKPDAEKV